MRGASLRELARLEHERTSTARALERPGCVLRHVLGAREARTCFLGAEDRLYVAWGAAGDYEISIWTGRVKGAPWTLGRRDLAWFRARSLRWKVRRERLERFLRDP